MLDFMLYNYFAIMDKTIDVLLTLDLSNQYLLKFAEVTRVLVRFITACTDKSYTFIDAYCQLFVGSTQSFLYVRGSKYRFCVPQNPGLRPH